MWHADAGRGGARSLAYSPDGRTLYAVTGAGRVVACDVGTHAVRDLFHLPPARAAGAGVVARPDGSDVLVYARGWATNPFWSWDVAAGRLVYPNARGETPGAAYTFLDTHYAAAGVAFARGGRAVYVLAASAVFRSGYSAPEPPANREFARLTRDAAQLAGTPDGARVAVSTARGTVVVWDAAADTLVTQVKLPFGTQPVAIAISSRGVLAVSLADEFRLYDADTGTPTAVSLVARPPTVVALSPASDVALTADGSAGVAVWRGGAPAGRYDWQVGKVRALAVAPDGLTAAVGGTSRRLAVVDLDG